MVVRVKVSIFVVITNFVIYIDDHMPGRFEVFEHDKASSIGS